MDRYNVKLFAQLHTVDMQKKAKGRWVKYKEAKQEMDEYKERVEHLKSKCDNFVMRMKQMMDKENPTQGYVQEVCGHAIAFYTMDEDDD